MFKAILIVSTELAEIWVEFRGSVLIDAAGVPPALAQHRVDGPEEADADVLVVLPLLATHHVVGDVAGQRQWALVGWQQRRVGQPIGALPVRPLRRWRRDRVLLLVRAQDLHEDGTCSDKRQTNPQSISHSIPIHMKPNSPKTEQKSTSISFDDNQTFQSNNQIDS